jgi:tRNA dimethylallyltransferase
MKVIIISGPTACGKSDLAIDLSLCFGGEIINFDSLLFYQELNIGTAKPNLLERKGIKHHMIDVRSINHPMNAAEFVTEANPIIKELHHAEKIVYLVGGSGFYLQAILKGMFQSETTPEEYILESQRLYQESGIMPFLNILAQNDPESLSRYHQNDHYRIRRAVEHFWTTGKPFSNARNNLERKSDSPWDTFHLHLDIPKAEHQLLIESRTEKMFNNGLVGELQGLLQAGFNGEEKPLQSIGYKEVVQMIKGEFKSIQECKERVIISTRQLAKAQRTWFKKDLSKVIFNPLNERDQIFHQVECFLNN